MKSWSPIYKTLSRVILFFLSLFLLVNSLTIISKEENNTFREDGICSNTYGILRIIHAGFKCSLSFLAGYVFSDTRFLKLGSI